MKVGMIVDYMLFGMAYSLYDSAINKRILYLI